MSTVFDREYDTIRVEQLAERVAHLQLDRRAELNAITESTLADLSDAVDALYGSDIQVLVVSGAGSRAFSVGAAIRDDLDELDRDTATDLSRRGQRAFGRLHRFPGPVIASISGYCLGGGMELAAAADLRIASPDATFGQPEAKLGVLPGWGGTQRLKRIIGTGRAKEVILTADEYGAEAMVDYGFVNTIAGEPFDAASEQAASLADHDAVAQRYAKRAIDHGEGRAGFRFESTAFGDAMESRDE